MDPFAYVSFLPSIIIALSMTRVLVGVGRILEARGGTKVYWVHLAWTFNLILYMVLNWWILFRWQAQPTWTFFLTVFLLLTPTVVFLVSVLLYPDPYEKGHDFKKHFFENRRWFFMLAAVLPPLDFIDTSLKGYAHLLAQGPVYFITIPLLTALSIVGALTKNERYHEFFAVFFLLYLLVFISVNLSILG